MNQEKKLTGHESWIRFRNRVIAGLGIFALITLYASFYFVGPISGKVVDAKTGEPIANIEINYDIDGSNICIPPSQCNGWGKGVTTYTDDNGKFKVPFSIAPKIPFLYFVDQNRRIGVNDLAKNKKYDRYNEEFLFWPLKSFKFALVPIPKTLDDCKDNLTEEEQYRCARLLAQSTKKNNLNELYITDKFAHALNNYCDEQLHADYTLEECRAVLAVAEKNKNICLAAKEYKYGYGGWDRCIFTAALDLQDKTWCDELPSENVKDYPVHYNITREKCEKIIDALTAEEK